MLEAKSCISNWKIQVARVNVQHLKTTMNQIFVNLVTKQQIVILPLDLDALIIPY